MIPWRASGLRGRDAISWRHPNIVYHWSFSSRQCIFWSPILLTWQRWPWDHRCEDGRQMRLLLRRRPWLLMPLCLWSQGGCLYPGLDKHIFCGRNWSRCPRRILWHGVKGMTHYFLSFTWDASLALLGPGLLPSSHSYMLHHSAWLEEPPFHTSWGSPHVSTFLFPYLTSSSHLYDFL